MVVFHFTTWNFLIIKMAKTKELLNQSQIAAKYNVDRATARQRLTDAGIVSVAGSHREKLYEVTPELEQAMVPDAVADYEVERAGKMKAERELKEMELAERRGELVEIAVVRNDLGRVFQKLIQKLETQLPYEISGALFKAESPEQCLTILRRSISGVFQDVRKEHEEYL